MSQMFGPQYKDWTYGVVNIEQLIKDKNKPSLKKIVVKYIHDNETTIKCIDSKGFVFYTSVKSLV